MNDEMLSELNINGAAGWKLQMIFVLFADVDILIIFYKYQNIG